jgi:spore coat protein H
VPRTKLLIIGALAAFLASWSHAALPAAEVFPENEDAPAKKADKKKKKKQTAKEPGKERGEGVFNASSVLRLRIEVPEEGIQRLRQEPKSFVQGTVREGDTVYEAAGIHVKGSLGSFQPIDSGKPGISIKFDRFKKGQRFHGLKKIILNNSVQDPTYLQEWLGNELFRAAGVPAPRIGWATVDLNGRRMGLYVISEAITGDFLSHWFGDSTGNLYEGPPDITSERLDVDSHHGVSDRADLKALIEATKIRETGPRMEQLEKLLDVDRFLSFAAMEAITCHWDGYVQGRNNYHVYHDPKGGKLVFLPHGLDQLFQNPQFPLTPTTNGVVARAVLKTAAGRRRYRERVKKLLDEVLVPEKLSPRIQDMAAKLGPALRKEGLGQALSSSMAARGLISRIEARLHSLRDQLAGQQVVTSVLGPPLRFDAEGKARLSGWQTRSMGGVGQFQRVQDEGENGGFALRVDIPPGGQGRSSWRRTAVLPPGRYTFLARIRTRGVIPSGADLNDGAKGGVDVRISGDQPSTKLSGTNDWTTYEFRFEIEPEEGFEGPQPNSQVELVCELQASAGTAWFDEASLVLVRKPFDA